MEPKLSIVDVYCSLYLQYKVNFPRPSGSQLRCSSGPSSFQKFSLLFSFVCKSCHEHKIMPLWDGSRLKKKYWKLCLKKGSEEHPLCPLWAGRVDPKVSRANATAYRTAGGLWCFSFVDIQELQFLGEREALLWEAVPGTHFFQKVPCTCSQIVALRGDE